MSSCQISWCTDPVYNQSLQLCEMHNRRRLRGQDLNAPKRGDHHTPVKWDMAHHRVRKLWGAASNHACVTCGGPANEWAYDGEDPTSLEDRRGRFSIHPEFYKPMCILHHRQHDAALRKAARHH